MHFTNPIPVAQALLTDLGKDHAFKVSVGVPRVEIRLGE